jgi:hypothetical protein
MGLQLPHGRFGGKVWEAVVDRGGVQGENHKSQITNHKQFPNPKGQKLQIERTESSDCWCAGQQRPFAPSRLEIGSFGVLDIVCDL